MSVAGKKDATIHGELRNGTAEIRISGPEGHLNLYRWTADQLDTLSGVGSSLAQELTAGRVQERTTGLEFAGSKAYACPRTPAGTVWWQRNRPWCLSAAAHLLSSP